MYNEKRRERGESESHRVRTIQANQSRERATPKPKERAFRRSRRSAEAERAKEEAARGETSEEKGSAAEEKAASGTEQGGETAAAVLCCGMHILPFCAALS